MRAWCSVYVRVRVFAVVDVEQTDRECALFYIMHDIHVLYGLLR